MIPKIIHYCWLSDAPFPRDIQRYIDSWRKNLKDYEFIKWDFDRFPKNTCPWVSEAFDCKKYAFAADYLRLYALYNFGGIYLDSDVKVLKSFDEFLGLSTMMCYENTQSKTYQETFLEVAAFGVAKGEKWVGDCLKHYEGRHFVKDNGEMDMVTLPEIVYEEITKNGYILKDVKNIEEAGDIAPNEIPVFPYDFFSPKNLYTFDLAITKNTYCIHNFKGSWASQPPVMNFLLKMGLKDKHALILYKKYALLGGAIKAISNGTFFQRLRAHFWGKE